MVVFDKEKGKEFFALNVTSKTVFIVSIFCSYVSISVFSLFVLNLQSPHSLSGLSISYIIV